MKPHLMESFPYFLENRLETEKNEAECEIWDGFIEAQTEVLDMIIDPNKKEREDEEKLWKDVKASKRQWRKIRKQRFAFLDAGNESKVVGANAESGNEEKKTDG